MIWLSNRCIAAARVVCCHARESVLRSSLHVAAARDFEFFIMHVDFIRNLTKPLRFYKVLEAAIVFARFYECAGDQMYV